jgi:hypothetical protein
MVMLLGAALALGGCAGQDKQTKAAPPKPKYVTLPARTNLPEFMKGTVHEAVDVQNKAPYPISGYGLVVGLDNTGNNNGVPVGVRNSMIDEMVRHGVGSPNGPMAGVKPEAVLRDPQTAIVEVYAMLPPGARSGQKMDVLVQAPATAGTTSLSRGMLYTTTLYRNGADPMNPRPKINPFGKAGGAVFVNPVGTAQARRAGVVMSGGTVAQDRPIILRSRTPQLSLTRAIERRINQFFAVQDDQPVASTQDEGTIYLVVPRRFAGDWERFMGVVTHLYLDVTPGAGALRARRLAEEALRPDAPLMDISYCWEGLGHEALAAVQGLYTHDSPEIAFAAARAGMYIGERGDSSAADTMLRIAKTRGHPFQLNAVKVLGSVPPSTHTSRMLYELLGTDNALVRVEAYRILAERQWPYIQSRRIHRGQFVIDRVTVGGPPLIFATRVGEPRIALFGSRQAIKTPILFNAMDMKFTISTPAGQANSILVFDRTNERRPEGAQVKMRPDLYELLLRLSGEADDGFRFAYSDLVGLLHALHEGKHLDATFVLQDLPSIQDAIEEAPPIVGPGEAAENRP